MNKELEALKLLQIEYDKIDYTIDIDGVDVITLLRQALNELEDAKHNYNALKEFYNNAVAYGAKIQKELNELKKRNEPMKVIFTRVGNAETEISWDEPTCPKCKSLVGGSEKFCGECGQKLDWGKYK